MVRRRERELSRAVQAAAAECPDLPTYRQAIGGALAAAIPHDGSCIGSVDPASVIFTSGTSTGLDRMDVKTFTELEFGKRPQVNSYAELAADPGGVRGLWNTLGPAATGTDRYQRLLRPAGMHDELRMAFRGSDRRCWGTGVLMRGSAQYFDADDAAAISTVAPAVGDGFRAVLLRQTATQQPDPIAGPAVVILDTTGDVTAATPQAQEYLTKLGETPGNDRLVAVQILAQLLKRGEREAARVRTRLPDGTWLVMHAGYLAAPTGDLTTVVVIEPASPPDIVALVAQALGLTPRETEVLEHVLAGRQSKAIAGRMSIREHTVIDHIKKIFVKAGVNSRSELVASLFYTQYAPHLDRKVNHRGWFHDPPAYAARAATSSR